MKNQWNLMLGLLFLACVGCSKDSNTVIPPVGGGLTPTQIEENKLEPTEERFGRPMVEEGQEAPKN